MRVFTIGFLVFLAFALYSRWYFVCQIRHRCGDDGARVTRPMTLAFNDGDKIILQGYEQFGFDSNSYNANLTENNQAFLEKITEYLQQYPDRKIILTGRYLGSEKAAKTGIFENVGIARARAVERLFEKLGVDEGRVSIDHELANGAAIEEVVSFAVLSAIPDPYEKLAYRFEDNTFSDANFAFNSAAFKPGEQCILYADSVRSFLDASPEMILSIIGHTDSIDTEKFNYNLGLERAKNAAQYFRELGLKAEIKVSSLGESQPVNPNSKPDGSDNPDGRQKNRRVNFKIIEKVLE